MYGACVTNDNKVYYQYYLVSAYSKISDKSVCHKNFLTNTFADEETPDDVIAAIS